MAAHKGISKYDAWLDWIIEQFVIICLLLLQANDLTFRILRVFFRQNYLKSWNMTSMR